MKTITTNPIPLYQPQPQPADHTAGTDHAPGAERVALAAVIVGGFTSAGALAIAGGLLYFIPATRPHLAGLLLIAVIIGILSAAATGVSFVWRAVTRQWSIDDQERWRRWELEDEARQQPEPETPPIVTPAEILTIAGYNILTLHLDGKDATRKECEALGITQTDWASINKILQALDIKRARGWNDKIPATTAITMWRTHVNIMPDAQSAMIKNDANNNWRRINLT